MWTINPKKVKVGKYRIKKVREPEFGNGVFIKHINSYWKCYVLPDIVFVRDTNGWELPISRTLFPELRELLRTSNDSSVITKSMLDDFSNVYVSCAEVRRALGSSSEVDESRFTCEIVGKVTRVKLNGTHIFIEHIDDDDHDDDDVRLYNLKYSATIASDIDVTPLNLMNTIVVYERLISEVPLDRSKFMRPNE